MNGKLKLPGPEYTGPCMSSTGRFGHCIRGHTLITLAHKGTWLVSKSEQNDNLVNRPYLVNMLTRVLSWSKIDKNMLT